MSRIVLLDEVSEYAYAWDIQPVAHELERLGIALTDNTGFNNSAQSRAAEPCFKVVICKFSYVVMYAFELLISV